MSFCDKIWGSWFITTAAIGLLCWFYSYENPNSKLGDYGYLFPKHTRILQALNSFIHLALFMFNLWSS